MRWNTEGEECSDAHLFAYYFCCSDSGGIIVGATEPALIRFREFRHCSADGQLAERKRHQPEYARDCSKFRRHKHATSLGGRAWPRVVSRLAHFAATRGSAN